MEWWQLLLIGVASIVFGVFLGFLPSYLPKGLVRTPETGSLSAYFDIRRWGKRRDTTPVVEEQSKYHTPSLLEEVETNLRIATEPWTGKLLPFQTRIWNTLQSEVSKLPVDLQEELSQAYIDIRLANSVVRLSTEFEHTTHDLNQSYVKLRTSIAERLTRVKPLMQNLKSNQSGA